MLKFPVLGACSAGLGDTNTSKPTICSQSFQPASKRKRVLPQETKETVALSLQELQRLVLLEQLAYTRQKKTNTL